MTAFEEWAVKMVEIALGDMKSSCEPDWGDTCGTLADRRRYQENYEADWASLGQRIACLLTQARALECRHHATELMVNGSDLASHVIAQAMLERGRKLELIALMFAKEWPPKERTLIEMPVSKREN